MDSSVSVAIPVHTEVLLPSWVYNWLVKVGTCFTFSTIWLNKKLPASICAGYSLWFRWAISTAMKYLTQIVRHYWAFAVFQHRNWNINGHISPRYTEGLNSYNKPKIRPIFLVTSVAKSTVDLSQANRPEITSGWMKQSWRSDSNSSEIFAAPCCWKYTELNELSESAK